MVTKTPEITDRKPRADAQRNRERILDVAKQEFTRVGANASLEDIAKKAGVGPGTLYRHFPTREDLLVAVYRSEMEKLAAAERTLAESKSPIEALRAWLLLFVDAVETKHIIAPVLNTLVGDPKKGSASRPGEAGDQERRHTQGPRPDRSRSGYRRRRQCLSQP
jgi:AcrR family transcriptional regulator